MPDSGQQSMSPRKRKEVADSQVKALAETAKAKIQQTSSVTGRGVCELFQMIAEDLAPIIMQPTPSDSLSLQLARPNSTNSGMDMPERALEDTRISLDQTQNRLPKGSCCFS